MKIKRVWAKFLVVAKDGGDYETVVSRVLATDLGILHIGEEGDASVNLLCIPQLTSKKLGKFSDILLFIPLDSKVDPVVQPCR